MVAGVGLIQTEFFLNQYATAEAYGSLRAGQGLLLTTEVGMSQLHMPSGTNQLEQAQSLVKTLADVAKQQRATLPDDPAELPADLSQKRLQEDIAATWSSGRAAGIPGGDGQTLGWAAPHLVGSGVADVLSQTPSNQVWVSGTDTVLAATSINWMVQGSFTLGKADGLVLFTHGGEPIKDSPNQERGIALHAAQNKLSARAHKNIASVAAKTNILVASTEAKVTLSAPQKHFLPTAKGAYIKIEGDNIELGAPGAIEFKATRKEWMGAASMSVEKPFLPTGEWTNWIEINHRDFDDEPFSGQAYKIFFEDGTVISGKLDDDGQASHEGVPKNAVRVEYEFPEPLEDKPWEPWKSVIAAARRKLG